MRLNLVTNNSTSLTNTDYFHNLGDIHPEKSSYDLMKRVFKSDLSKFNRFGNHLTLINAVNYHGKSRISYCTVSNNQANRIVLEQTTDDTSM